VNNAGQLTDKEELTEAIIKTNYYGAEGLTKALIPLLQFSTSPKIVNVSSSLGRQEVNII
jgi:(+)-neomenthol dehydrogenase